MSTSTLQITDKLLDYIREVSVREDQVLEELRLKTSTLEESVMQISPEQGGLMQLLTRLISARRCVEVGVFTGYSGLCVAKALPEDGVIDAYDISEKWTSIAREYWERAGVAHKIRLHLMPATEGLRNLLQASGEESIDMAFIDADKTNYQTYYELCLALLRPGGLLLIDNTLWSGDVIDKAKHDPDTEAIRELNDHIRKDNRVWKSLIPISDGLTLAVKKHPSDI